MKKNITFIGALFVSVLTFAQDCSITFYAEMGEKFTVMINGQKQNETPQSNVKVDALNSGLAYKAVITIENVANGTLSKTLYMEPNTINSANVMKNKKGEYVLRYMGAVPAPSAPAAPVASAPAPAPQRAAAPPVSNTNVTTTTTTTTTAAQPVATSTTNSTGFSMNVNVNDETGNASISMNVNDGMNPAANVNMNVNSTTTYSETTTTTTSSSTPEYTNAPAPAPKASSSRCDYPMDNSDFESGKKSIESKTFSDAKLTVAKQIIKANCPTADQVKGFVSLFTFEEGKLEIAKFAYDFVYDKGNYYKVNDAFTFEGSIDELNEYIESK